MQGEGSEPDNTDHTNNTNGGTVVTSEKPFIIVDIERPAALPATSVLPGPSRAATTQSEKALMPPPAAKPIPAAVPVPDPDLV